MPPRNTVAQARTSCSRCHQRKKRCDRSLPECGNCRRAVVPCSFLDSDAETASYPIGYVRALERKVQDLEASLANPNHAPESSGYDDNFTPSFKEYPTWGWESSRNNEVSSEISLGGLSSLLRGEQGLYLPSGYPIDTSTEYATSTSTSHPRLDDALKQILSDGSKENELGPSSGFAFAKLTQTKLESLAMIRSDGVEEHSAVHHLTLDTTFDLLNSDAFNIASDSVADNDTTLAEGLRFDNIPINASPNPDTVHLDVSQSDRLVDLYFAHSHIIYPIIDEQDFRTSLETYRGTSASGSPIHQSPLCLFRIWMVLAIGSTAYCSVDTTAEPDFTRYYNQALNYSESAANMDNMAAIEVIILHLTYSLFNHLQPNTWLLVGMAARIALGIGLHSAATYEGLPADTVERRKRLFFSLYMMDRVVSTTLGRPFAIHDDDISISPFVVAHDQTSLDLSSMAIPLHILKLRKISSRIRSQVYTVRDGDDCLSDAEREESVHSIHKDLIQWRRDMPFPLPKVDAPVPHFTSTWYDFNYHTHLTLLYRPTTTPLLPTTLNDRRMKILADSASSSIRLASSMHRQGTFSHHWMNLHAVFMSAVTQVYIIASDQQQDDDGIKKNVLKTRAADDVQLAVQLLGSLECRFSSARKVKELFSSILQRT